MMTETEETHTFTVCHIDTPAGKKFLRRVMKDNADSSWDESWGVRCGPHSEWKIEFRRTLKGEIGDPERTVVVMTDYKIPVYYEPGERKSFSDSKPVWLCPCKGIWLNRTDVGVLCSLLLHKDIRISVEGHAGSTSSSEHGISFYYLEAKSPSLGGCVRFGSETVAVHGRRVCSGSVEI